MSRSTETHPHMPATFIHPSSTTFLWEREWVGRNPEWFLWVICYDLWTVCWNDRANSIQLANDKANKSLVVKRAMLMLEFDREMTLEHLGGGLKLTVNVPWSRNGKNNTAFVPGWWIEKAHVWLISSDWSSVGVEGLHCGITCLFIHHALCVNWLEGCYFRHQRTKQKPSASTIWKGFCAQFVIICVLSKWKGWNHFWKRLKNAGIFLELRCWLRPKQEINCKCSMVYNLGTTF